MNRKFNVTEQDRFMAISSMCFDLSVYDLFGALSAGASVVLVSDQRDVRNLLQTMEKHRVTIWNSVPAIMSMLIDYTVPSPDNTALRLVLLSGDWIPLQLPGQIAEAFPAAATISLGGATEVSIWSIYHPIDTVNTGWKSIPYGKPLANQTIYVLDFAGELCPPGVQGELYIGGAGLAEGYLFDEEKTSQSLIEHHKLGRLYRTGDFGILHREGWIEFLGRKDHQVKIRGYRVELGEIESCLARHDLIRHAVVVDHREENGHKSLCAYVVSDEQLAVSELREYAAKLLPDYMIPSYFVQMDDIPLTPNGKLDRSALPKPQDHLHLGVLYEAPGNETEERLVALWQQLLDTPKVGIHDNFFELGGNSLLLVELHARLDMEFPGKLALTDLFAYPSVARLAERLNAGTPERATKLEGVVFPAEYDADSDSLDHTASFKFRIGSESYGRLREIAKHHKAEISDLLLYIYSYVIADATGQSQVAVHTMLQERDRVNAYSIDESSMEDIGGFAESLRSQRDSRDGEYRIAEAGRTRLRDSSGSRALFIYRKELYAGQSDLASVYDLVLELDEDGDDIQFVCEFQASRLKEESVERLMDHYVRMIDFVGNEYSSARIGS
jgi:hypothetical protein